MFSESTNFSIIAQQPACFAYDDMNNMTSLRTFRADGEVITTDPSERSDYDETTWAFHATTDLEMSKTYADNTSVLKTYDAYNRLATETDARGNVKTHAYEHARGLHLGTSYIVVAGTAATSERCFTYNHLGQMLQVVDDSGTRTFSYNSYGERETDSLVVDGDTHLITEQCDSFGRTTGYIYSKNGSTQQTVSTGYGDDGRICSAGFLHGGEAKNFGYTYLAGSNLLQILTKPNGMALTQTYEATRDLLSGMAYHRGSTLVAQRTYSYDILGRPAYRNTDRQGTIVNDSFAHNSRSELVAAQVSGTNYEYSYDNIGNRLSSIEGSNSLLYNSNELNQYTSLSENEASVFEPLYDDDGNQTLTKTSTGIWSIVYNAENRPVTFTNTVTDTVVECQYDSMGRRAYKKVTTNGAITIHQRYIYRGYLQIACIDLTRTAHPSLWLITWDPTQSLATRPIAIQKDGTWYTYGWDLTKNICEVYRNNGYIGAVYNYSPYGEITTNGSVNQPIMWSSEVNDQDTALTYYNYRYYTAYEGRWLSYDPFISKDSYFYLKNQVFLHDFLGLMKIVITHARMMYGDNGTYGAIKIQTDDDTINGECNLPQIYLTIEPYKNRPKHNLMQAPQFNEPSAFRIENTKEGDAGRTCPLNFLEKNPNLMNTANRMCGAAPEDWQTGINFELHVQGSINIHAGIHPGWSHGCILIGNYYVGVELPMYNNMSTMFPRYSEEKNKSFGFDHYDTAIAYAYLMSSLACALRKHNCKTKKKSKELSSTHRRIETSAVSISETTILKMQEQQGRPIICLWNPPAL